jgi:hypothetical protein
MRWRLALAAALGSFPAGIAPACGGSTARDGTPVDAGSAGAGGTSGATGTFCAHDSRAPAGCALEWELVDPCPLLPGADSYEVVVFPGGCPDDQRLSSGDTSGATARQFLAPGEPFAPISGLEAKQYGFAVVAREWDCHVVGWGCTEAAPGRTGTMITSLRNWTASDQCRAGSSGLCPPGEICGIGRCETPGWGACDFQVVSAGNLDLPPGGSIGSVRFEGPALVATPEGFVLVYAERAGARLTVNLVRLGDAGESTLASSTAFDAGCAPAGAAPSGVGIAFSGSEGLVAAALPDCGGGAGAGACFLPFDARGNASSCKAPRNPDYRELTLAPSGALSAGTNPGEFLVAYRAMAERPVAYVMTLKGADFTGASQAVFEGLPVSFVSMATAERVGGLVASGPGMDVVLELYGSSIDGRPLGSSSLPISSRSAALTAWDNRVAFVVPVPSENGAGYSWQAVEAAGGGLVEVTANGFDTEAESVAIAALGDHLLMAIGQIGGIQLERHDGARGALGNLPSLGRQYVGAIGAASLGDYDGKRVALAAARERMAVAWLSATGESGGWALLRCGR